MRRRLSVSAALLSTVVLSVPACAGPTSDPVTVPAGVPVSVNPHAATLPAKAPPLVGLASLDCTIANAYHVSSDQEVERALAYPAYGKPKILSDDAGEVTAEEATRWIARACEAGAHYEHFDAALGPNAMRGVTIDSLDDFGDTGRRVLRYIAEESCASDLEPGGRLSRDGTELLWNGEPARLVGQSWMGAVAGKSFDVEAYLDVLAEHRVNLTRVWAVEQWTGLGVSGEDVPLADNALLPFAGDAVEGTVDLETIHGPYIERLQRFARAAGERGIVVQLTLFDRHGLLVEDEGANARWGRWRGSPYNRANARSGGFEGGPGGKAPRDFVALCRPDEPGPLPDDAPESCRVQRLHHRFIAALRDALAGEGNVIFEVMNEPLAEEWGDEAIVSFHRWVAGVALGADGGRCFDR